MSRRHGSRIVVAGVRSRTHLVYAASWLRSRAAGLGDAPIGVLPTGSFLGAPRVSTSDIAGLVGSVLPGEVHADVGVEWARTGGPGERVTLLSVGAPPLRLLPSLLRSGRRPHIVVVDEGLGSYGDVGSRRAAYRRNGDSAAWSAVRAAAVSAGRSMLVGEAWPTYRHTSHGWVVNDDVAGEFRRRVSGDPPSPGTAVLLTQPWPGLAVMSEDAYLAHVRDIERACASAGLALTVRVHPADPADRYRDFAVAPSSVPAELDRAVIDAAVVLGASSTALLNLAAFYGTRCLRVRNAELESLDRRLGRRQAALLDTFLPSPVAPGSLRLG